MSFKSGAASWGSGVSALSSRGGAGGINCFLTLLGIAKEGRVWIALLLIVFTISAARNALTHRKKTFRLISRAL